MNPVRRAATDEGDEMREGGRGGEQKRWTSATFRYAHRTMTELAVSREVEGCSF